MPTGQLPVLEVDGKQLSQSMAIARYVGREFGLAGKNNLEQCMVDQVIDTASDCLTEYVKSHFEKDEKKKVSGIHYSISRIWLQYNLYNIWTLYVYYKQLSISSHN
ncbi:glutathione S-transferase-like [Mizuhopecten yessoensis]|uniref:glutathione S-transferase-like n=1 Tax=Mizuhopecten yessoensis TaxID=6573 RepID=UPI000B4577CA|nr:glutathione S-transferase-like [Mizuhopecten yessoensis]